MAYDYGAKEPEKLKIKDMTPKQKELLIDNDDELISGSLISKDGVILKSEIIENGGTRS